jgi:hypothetical protein
VSGTDEGTAAVRNEASCGIPNPNCDSRKKTPGLAVNDLLDLLKGFLIENCPRQRGARTRVKFWDKRLGLDDVSLDLDKAACVFARLDTTEAGITNRVKDIDADLFTWQWYAIELAVHHVRMINLRVDLSQLGVFSYWPFPIGTNQFAVLARVWVFSSNELLLALLNRSRF